MRGEWWGVYESIFVLPKMRLSALHHCLFSLPGCISRYSAGSIYYYPSYHHQHNPAQVECFQKDLKRYLTRKIGFEAVMRIRCTKGPSENTFSDVTVKIKHLEF